MNQGSNSEAIPGLLNPAPVRVLLLDDDPFLLEVLADTLTALGQFAIHSETDARQALATLAANPPDLMICDLSLPGMDGIEFLHAAAEGAFQGWVMLLTGMDAGVRKAAETLARAHGLRVLGAFAKPISMEELGTALAPLLTASGAQDR